MAMDPGFWDAVRALFGEALDLDPLARTAFLADRCEGRPALRAEIESLLAAHDRPDGRLERDAAGSPLGDEPGGEASPGQAIGPFRLAEKIGEGGMGAVYRAERQDGDFRQRVAIKLIHLPLRNPDARRRFRAERQILATLSHPYIVALLDGGISAPSQAYLVMEYVDGLPITAYCRERRLPLEDRLRLFEQVCAGVQHAHQHGVVHRDLKPANILVTADGAPKILDFGVGKLMDDSGSGVDATATGMLRPLTPNYASPEQVRGLPVTTASDVYALGVLLYELLSAVRPYQTAGRTLDEILEMVSEKQPLRPSAQSGDAGRSLPYDVRRLRGDLDAIVLKAMSKDPERRYASAREMAEDVGRRLAGRPVLAREPSPAYLVFTLAKRHRTAVAATLVALLALVAALGVSLWQMRVVTAERNRATSRFNDVRQLANALIFTIHDEVQPLAGSTPVRQSIVSEALKYLERLSRDPASDDALRLELARAYHRIGSIQGLPSVPNLGDREGALKSLTRSLELLRPMVGRPDMPRDGALQLGRTALAFATTAGISGARDEARSAVREAASTAEALIRRDPNDADARRLAGSALFDLALLTSDPDSLAIWQRAGEVFGALLAEQPGDPDRQRNVALVEKYIGKYYERQGDSAAALRHHQRALTLDQQRLAADPSNRRAQFDVAIDLTNVGHGERKAGRLMEAAAAYERSAAIQAELAASDPSDVLAQNRLAWAYSHLARAHAALGRQAPARQRARAAVDIAARLDHLDPTYRRTLALVLVTLGDVEGAAGRGAAGCQAFRRARRVIESIDPGDLSPDAGLRRTRGEIDMRLAACAANAGARGPREAQPPGAAKPGEIRR